MICRLRMPGLVPGVLFWALLGGAAWADPCRAPADLVPAVVKHVSDGDTLLLADGRRLRLIGFNAPELSRNGAPAEPLAEAARRALAGLAPAGSTLYLELGAAPRDRHGRLLAHAFRGPKRVSIEAELLRRGFGFRVAIPPNLSHQECFAAAEQEARRAARGVWREPKLAPVPAASLTAASAGFRRVRAHIEKVEESERSWWLETDGPLVLRLDKTDLRHFADVPAGMGKDPRRWVGKGLVVRGWITDRAGQPEVRKRGLKPLILRLQHTSMLE